MGDAQGADTHAPVVRRDDQRVRARHDRDAVEPAERIGDERRGEVVLGGQRVAVDGARIAAGPGALGDDEPPVVGALQAVGAHVALREQGEERIGAAERDRREVVARGDVVLVHELRERVWRKTSPATSRMHEASPAATARVACWSMSMPAAPPVAAVHQPAEAEAESDREVDRVVGRERERRDPESVDRTRFEACVAQSAPRRVREHLGRRQPGRRVARIGRLRCSDDRGVARHAVIVRPRVRRDRLLIPRTPDATDRARR